MCRKVEHKRIIVEKLTKGNNEIKRSSVRTEKHKISLKKKSGCTFGTEDETGDIVLELLFVH